ncbi:hypothetical protein L0F63_007498 [Massospora cicadina]|nr:hypothetical protein L0F63_007498 [Massospora cicadina]
MGIKPEQVDALVKSVVSGIGLQLDQVLEKAKEIDKKGGTREQKLGELEAEINEAALALSKKLGKNATDSTPHQVRSPLQKKRMSNQNPKPIKPSPLQRIQRKSFSQ